MTWRIRKDTHGCYTCNVNTLGKIKIAAFDLDFTLIKPHGKAKFSKDSDDWEILNDNVVPTLVRLYSKGFVFAIFSNQGGIAKGKTTHNEVQTKISNVITYITNSMMNSSEMIKSNNNNPIKFNAFYSAAEDDFRKPQTFMWDYFVRSTDVDMRRSFYCGDAAGRISPKDFSDSDVKFATNIGLRFFTPEHLFFGDDSQVPGPFFNPRQEFESDNDTLIQSYRQLMKIAKPLRKDRQEVVILVGSPGSGKTTFCANYVLNHVRINRDTLGTIPKCVKEMIQLLQQGKNVIVDNTNPTRESREKFIEAITQLNTEYGVDEEQGEVHNNKILVRCIIMSVQKDLAFHLDNQRQNNKEREHHSKRVGKIPIHSFFKKYEEPGQDEGFDLIQNVNFVPGPFESEGDQESFYLC